MRSITVIINGTQSAEPPLAVNPAQDKTCVSKKGFSNQTGALGELEMGPITSTAQIRAILKGWSAEFKDLCCANFKKDEVVQFTAYWDK